MIDKEWAIVELMGHRKLAGYCTDDGGMLRIDVYDNDPDGSDGEVTPLATQWYGAAAIYCITASTKAMCLAVTANHQPAPVGRWELPERATAGVTADEDESELEDATPVDDDGFPY